jgi:16S rRNA processing protein RimM
MAMVKVGRIGRAHGLRGEVTLDQCSLTEAELEGISEFVWRGRRGETRSLVLRSVRPVHARFLAAFEGCDDRDQAAALGQGELLAPSERLPDAGADQAYTFQLVGLEVRTEEGRVLGRVADVLHTGAHPIYVVRGEREIMIPATPPFVSKVDLDSGTIVVSLPPGLEEL